MPHSVLAAVKRMDMRMMAALSLTGFVLVGVCAIAVGFLFDPLTAEFHWSNAATSGLATSYSLASLLSGPVFGVIIDRIGSRGVMASGVALVALGFLGLSACHTLGAFYAAFVLIGIGYGGAFFLASSTLIAIQMGKQKDLAMGIWMGAGSTGAAIFSLIVSASMAAFGWKMTSIVSGLLVMSMVPVILMLIPRPAGEPRLLKTEAKARALPLQLVLAPQFLLLSLASAFAAFGMSAIYYHAVPILQKSGFSARAAGLIFGASWITSAVGSLGAGVVADRLGSQQVLSGSLLLGMVGSAALLILPSPQLALPGTLLFIVLWGATANAVNQFLPILLVERFGPTHLGALVGVQGALMGLVGSFAPLLTGRLYDHYANYTAAILTSVVTTLLALACVLVVRRAPVIGMDSTAANPATP